VFGRLFGRRRAAPASPELGTLGTHAFVVTEWQPGPTSWRPVQLADRDVEAPRTANSSRGPLVFSADLNFPLFQGEKASAPGQGVNVNDYVERYAAAVSGTGYPS
jgi:hypothetical protein